MIRYRFDPGSSRFTVQAFASGLLSMLGHSPTFAVRDFAGEMGLTGETFAGALLQIAVRADSLTLVDAVSPSDRAEIEGRMRREVLETAAYPEIAFQGTDFAADKVSSGQYRLRIMGRLSLHGVTNPHAMDAQLLVYEDGIRLSGGFALQPSAYRIRPVTALGGAIKLKDHLQLSFDLAGWKEGG
jgi:polyisoprenoid-binding protein YceI